LDSAFSALILQEMTWIYRLRTFFSVKTSSEREQMNENERRIVFQSQHIYDSRVRDETWGGGGGGEGGCGTPQNTNHLDWQGNQRF
jgi:hypothetical protein